MAIATGLFFFLLDVCSAWKATFGMKHQDCSARNYGTQYWGYICVAQHLSVTYGSMRSAWPWTGHTRIAIVILLRTAEENSETEGFGAPPQTKGWWAFMHAAPMQYVHRHHRRQRGHLAYVFMTSCATLGTSNSQKGIVLLCFG